MSTITTVPTFEEVEQLARDFLSKPHISAMVQIRYWLTPRNPEYIGDIGNPLTDVVDRQDLIGYLRELYERHTVSGRFPDGGPAQSRIHWILVSQYGGRPFGYYGLSADDEARRGTDGRITTDESIDGEDMVWPPAVDTWNYRDGA